MSHMIFGEHIRTVYRVSVRKNCQTCRPVVGTGISGGGGSIANGIAGGYCRNSGKGGRGFYFLTIDCDF